MRPVAPNLFPPPRPRGDSVSEMRVAVASAWEAISPERQEAAKRAYEAAKIESATWRVRK